MTEDEISMRLLGFSSVEEFDQYIKGHPDYTCGWCSVTINRQDYGIHMASKEHKDNVTKGCMSRPAGDFCDGCGLLIMADYDALCKVGFAFRYKHPDGEPSFIFNLFRYINEDIGPAVDEMGLDEGDYDDWDIRAVKPSNCKKHHPALYKKPDSATAVDVLLQGIADLRIQIVAEVEPSSSPLLNPNTHTFTRGKHENIPIWNVAVIDPEYLVYLCQESETDEGTITLVEEYIENNPDKFEDIEI